MNKLVPPSSGSPIQYQKLKRENKSLYQYFSLNRLKFRDRCLQSWTALQAHVTTVVRLGIISCRARRCLVSPTSHKEQEVVSKGNNSQEIELKDSCTKWSF